MKDIFSSKTSEPIENNSPILSSNNGLPTIDSSKLSKSKWLRDRLSNKFLIASIIIFGLAILYSFNKQLVNQVAEQVVEQYNHFSAERSRPDFFSGFSKLTLGSHPIKDAFTLKPEKFDSLGVDGSSAYILESKQKLKTDIVQEDIKIEPTFQYDLKKISNTQWRIEPKDRLQPNTLVRIALADKLTKDAQGYSWAYQTKDTFKVLNSIPRDEGTSVPIKSGIEVVFSHENYKDYEKYFEITPDVAGSFEKHDRTLVFVPNEPLKPRTLYKVTVKNGLPLIDSQENLADSYSFSFETDAADGAKKQNEWLEIYERTIETTTEHPPVVQLSANLYDGDPIKAELFKFASWKEYLEALRKRGELPWWSYAKENFQIDTGSVNKISSFDLPIRTSDKTKYVEFPENLSQGFYLAELSFGDYKNQVLIQVSDLSAYYNVTKTDTLVWANDTKTKKSIENAQVELIDTQKKFITDNKGIAKFTTPEEIIFKIESKKNAGEKNDELYFKISKGDNILIVPASQVLRSYWWEKPDEANAYWRYLYTDRPRYQATDTIHYWGLLKSRDNEKVDGEITATLYKEGYVDYYYQPVSIVEQKISLSEFQTFQGEINIKDLRPDYYTLELKAGDKVIQRKYISIRPYTKPAFELSITPDKKAAFAGESIKLRVKANFFEGTPVPNMDLLLKAPGGDQQFTTNENGEAELDYTKEYVPCAREYSCWPNYAYLQVVPKNSEVAEIEASTNVRFFGPRAYAEAKTSYPKKGLAEIKIESKYIDIKKANDEYWSKSKMDGAVAPNVTIEGSVVKITHQKNETGTHYDFISKQTYKTYSYSTSKEELRSFAGITDQNGKYIFQQPVEPEVSYQVNYKVFDNDGNYENYNEYLYYYDGKNINRYSTWDYNYYRLDTDKEEYSLGEEVKASFKNNDNSLPSGKSRYLFLQLQNGLQEYSVTDHSEYKFSFDRQDIPNVNLTGVYFNGVTYEVAAASYMGQQVKYKFKDEDLKIKVSPDKKSYLPGGEVALDIELKNKNNQPVEAEVNLNLVDEAYYAVAEDVASPLETIYANVGSGSLFQDKTHYNVFSSSSGAEKGGCFAAGTLVKMADGSEKAIETVQKGDEVLTFSDPIEKDLVKGMVTETWKHTVAEYLIINDYLNVTPEHQIFSNNRFIDAGMLKKGDWMLNSKGEKVFVSSIILEHEIITVFNLKIDPQHTFFAGDVYVHNEEKGGGPREFFTDATLFEVVKTNVQGKAEIKFKLPDNITSWRITAQAISQNLEAGVNITKLPVTLPVFADVTVGSEYLTGDRPIARMRAYGTSLNENDQVSFSVSAPTLGVEKTDPIATTAFSPSFYALPDLSLGNHPMTYNLKTAKGDDAINLPLNAIFSRLEYQAYKNEKLSTETKFSAVNDLPMTIVLSDEGRNKLYGPLHDMSWSQGDRIDQKYVSKQAKSLLNKYYQEEISNINFSPSTYQLPEGGISLLPYSGAELELSARIAAMGVEDFDRESLVQYFFKKLEDKKSNREEISFALFGLAELREPVLARINSWILRDDLSVKEKLYLAQALFDLGNDGESRKIFYEVIDEYGQQKNPHIIIRVSDDLDEVFQATALTAALAASLDATEADGLFNYVICNQSLYGEYKNSENLFNLEKISFISHRLPQLKPSPAKVIYKLNGQRKEAQFTGTAHSFQLPPELADSLSFVSVTGDVDISIRYTDPFIIDSKECDSNIAIGREYLVNGDSNTYFSEDDIVEVRLYPSFSAQALAGEYQITDALPSGLSPISKIMYESDCNYRYPYDVDGQLVKYKINKNWKSKYCGGTYIKYYARVKNRGTYKAEPAIIQSFSNPDSINYSGSEEVTINE